MINSPDSILQPVGVIEQPVIIAPLGGDNTQITAMLLSIVEQMSVDQIEGCLALLTTRDLPPEPNSMSEALASHEAEEWKRAADEEFHSL